MALTKIKTEIDLFLDKEAKKIGSGYIIGGESILEVTVGGKDFIDAMLKVTERILDQIAPTLKKYNTKTNWNEALNEVTSELLSMKGVKVGNSFQRFQTGKKFDIPAFGPPTLNPGVYADTLTKTRLKLSLVSSDKSGLKFNNTQAKELFTGIRGALWDKWIRIVDKKSKTANNLPGSNDQGKRSSGDSLKVRTGTIKGLLGTGGVKAAHSEKTTKASFVLDRLVNNAPQTSLPAIINSRDIGKEVQNSLKLNYSRQRTKRKLGTYVQANVVEVRFERNTGEDTDLTQVKQAIAKTLRRRIAEAMKAGLIANMTEKASKPFTEGAQEDVIKTLVDSFKTKKTKVTKKTKAKKFTPIKDSIAVKKPTRTASKKQAKNIRIAGATTFRQASGKREGKTETLASLKSKINRRLPAEVRRNMGRPALINQTGRFSNSVELVNLKQGPKTLVGDYTYMHNPYRTFENQGQRKWPVGYNPKPLIAKSIRNLAMQYAEEKFTLRRV